MKTNSCRRLAVGLFSWAVAGAGLSALATLPPINGSMSFVGSYSVDGPLNVATAFTSFSNVTAGGSQTGIYTNVPVSTPAVLTPFAFNPASTPVIPLWSCTNGGVVYSFDATSVKVINQSSSFINLVGTGIARATGNCGTPGTWWLSGSASGGIMNGGFSVNSTNLPTLLPPVVSNGVVFLTWNALAGQQYQLLVCTNWPSTNWQSVGGVLTATNSAITTTDYLGSDHWRCYRVQVVP